jgi:hypothetical protein
MTVVSLTRRLNALETRSDSVTFDHLSDEELEARILEIRARIIEGLAQEGVEFPPDWHLMTTEQRDRWAHAKIDEMDL